MKKKIPARVVDSRFGPVPISSQPALQFLLDQAIVSHAYTLRGAVRKEAQQNYFEQRNSGKIDIALTYVNFAMAFFLLQHVFLSHLHVPIYTFVTTAFSLPLTVFLADIITAFLHKFLDNYASEDYALWGSPARAFRKHHEFPSNLNTLPYILNIAAFAQTMAPMYMLTIALRNYMNPPIAASVLLLLLLLSNATEIHRQSHLHTPLPWIQKLQEYGLLLSSVKHARHHRQPIDSDYAIINGWSNEMLAGVWEPLDMLVWKLTDTMPGNWIENPRSIPPAVISEMKLNLKIIPEKLVIVVFDERKSSEEIDEIVRLWRLH